MKTIDLIGSNLKSRGRGCHPLIILIALWISMYSANTYANSVLRIRVGSTVTVAIYGSLSDSNDAAEGESILITSSGGYSYMLPVFNGTVVVQFIATVSNESVSMQIINGDGDESAGITVMGDSFDPDLNLGKSCTDGAMVGDPVNAFTGNQMQRVTDFSPVTRRAFPFERYMNSASPWPYAPHLNTGGVYPSNTYHLGAVWTHTYNYFVTVYGSGYKVHRPDGRVLVYMPVDSANPGGAYHSLQEPRGYLGPFPNFGGYGGIIYRSPDGVLAIFNTAQQTNPYTLRSLTYPDGFYQTINGDMDSVNQYYGQDGLSFGYVSMAIGNGTSNRYLRSVQDSMGHAWIYDYTYDPLQAVYQDRIRLSKATFTEAYLPAYATTTPSGPSRIYLYGEPGYQATLNDASPQLLTGIIDESGIRYESFYYDEQGRNYRTEHPGGADRTSLTFAPDYANTVVSDAYGDYAKTPSYSNLVAKSGGTSQPAGSGCAAASSLVIYDDTGNISSADDYNGHRTCYSYDSFGMEIARVEGLSNSGVCASAVNSSTVPIGARKISTTWRPIWSYKSGQAEPKKITFWVYNGMIDPSNGNAVINCAPDAPPLPDGQSISVLCKVVEQATLDADGSQGFSAAPDTGIPTRTSFYTYDAYGNLATAKDASGHVNRYSYSSDGRLQTFQNAVGHLTKYLSYDKVGNLLKSVDPTGAVTDIAYFPRGWIQSITVTPSGGGQPQVTSYTYDLVGKAKSVTLPGGSTLLMTYDDAHRLTSVSDGAGNTVTYTLDEMGNRIGEQQKGPTGVLSSNVTRVYDALNRLQSVTGAPR